MLLIIAIVAYALVGTWFGYLTACAIYQNGTNDIYNVGKGSPVAALVFFGLYGLCWPMVLLYALLGILFTSGWVKKAADKVFG
jgi:hypothetical protein